MSSFIDIIKLTCIFYGVLIAPGFLFSRQQFSELKSSQHIYHGFIVGMLAHFFSINLIKITQLYSIPGIYTLSLALTYLLLYFLTKKISWSFFTPTPTATTKVSWHWIILSVAIVANLVLSFLYRARSPELSGDGLAHLILIVQHQINGPLPDFSPFYSTPIVNYQATYFHALLYHLGILSHLHFVDVLRYFSFIFTPLFVLTLYTCFEIICKNKLFASLLALQSIMISGGGQSLEVPIAFFPWYWALGWSLFTSVIIKLIQQPLYQKTNFIFLAIGVLIAVSMGMAPMLMGRWPFVLVILALLTSLVPSEFSFFKKIKNIFINGCLLSLGILLSLGVWLFPLLIKHGLEPTYSLQEITSQFQNKIPQSVNYFLSVYQTQFSVFEIFIWMQRNMGMLLAYACLAAFVASLLNKNRTTSWAITFAVPIAMLAALLIPAVPIKYRLFEYLFLGFLLVLANGYFLLDQSEIFFKKYLLWGLTFLLFTNFAVVYPQKVKLTASIYGRNKMDTPEFNRAYQWETFYLQAQKNNQLDEVFGNFRNYLVLRHKKIWDIHAGQRIIK